MAVKDPWAPYAVVTAAATRWTTANRGASGVSVMYLYGCMGQWGMANRTAPALVLREGDRGELERLTRAATVMASTAQRARIVLLAADGVGNQVIADTVGVSRPTVNLWRDRYAEPTDHRALHPDLRSATSRARSAPSSTVGTDANKHSCGPKLPTRFLTE